MKHARHDLIGAEPFRRRAARPAAVDEAVRDLAAIEDLDLGYPEEEDAPRGARRIRAPEVWIARDPGARGRSDAVETALARDMGLGAPGDLLLAGADAAEMEADEGQDGDDDLDEDVARKLAPRRLGERRRSPELAERFQRNRAEEPALIAAWREHGDARALETLVARYQPLFNTQIGRVLAGGSIQAGRIDDLRQEASLAFVAAVNAFDPARGVELAAFAKIHVRNALLRYTLDYRAPFRIGTSSDDRKAYYAAQAVSAAKTARGEDGYLDDADKAEIAARTRACGAAVDRAVSAVYARRCDLDDASDIAVAPDEIETTEDRMGRDRAMAVVRSFLEGQDERRRAVIEDLFLSEEPADARDLARRFGVTTERVGQIKRQTLTDLGMALKRAGITADALFA